MRIGEKMRKWISMILCLCMLVQNAPMMVFAASTDNLCEHHPKHTEDCGYVEAVEGKPCTHEHSEACYKIVECKHTCSDECDDPCTTHTCTVDDGCITMEQDCHHVHGECGYAEAVEPQDCTTCQPVLVHAENCGYVESADEVTCACEPTVTHGGEGCTYVEGKDGSPCTHVCAVVVDSDDSCYKLLCSHKDGGHDDACGYVAAVEGHACHYECTACEADADDEEPEIPEIAEGVCAHGNSEENCETCVAEIQVMINALPDMEDITDENRADVISRMEAIDSRKWKLSDAARGKLDFDKYADAAFVLSTPPNFFGIAVEKRYEVGASEMPQASFAFLDASGVAATVITAEGMETTSVEPVSNGGAVRGYLPVGEYTLDETVVGDWNLTMSVNGQADDDHTFTGEGGRAYRIETVNVWIPSYITIASHEHGSVGVKYATGEEIVLQDDKYNVTPYRDITLTATPESGYVFDRMDITSLGQPIDYNPEVNPCTFTMPNDVVVVDVTFKPCDHDFDPDTGKCTACETEMAEASVEIGDTTTYFETLADAVTEAEDGTAGAPATLTLLKNIALGKIYPTISSGVMTLNLNGCKLEGSGEYVLKISGDETSKPDVTVTGGTITGATYGVFAENSNVTVTGGTITGATYGVFAANSDVNISGGTITSTSTTRTDYGVYASGSTVEISGGTISGDSYGVYADLNSTVTIGGGTISGYTGVYASGGTVTIKDGTITGSNYGVVAEDSSTVEISGGEVSGDFKGVWVTNSTMKITGGKITGKSETPVLADSSSTVKITGGTIDGAAYGVIADNSTVEISGGTITCGNSGLLVANTGSITLTLGEDGTGATFPVGLNVSGTTLDDILDKDKDAAYWKDGKMISLSDNQTAITGGIVTVEVECEHKNATYPADDINDTQHKVDCPCGYENLEDHTFNDTDGKCSKCKTDLAVAKVEIGDTTTYFETLADAVTEAEDGTAEAPATLTLLENINLEDRYQEINSGVMTLNLNGCTLAGSGPCVLYIIGNETSKPDVTITDSSEAGNGTITGTDEYSCGVYANESAVTISGGKISATGEDSCGVQAYSNSTVTISGGEVSSTNEDSYGVYAYNSTVEISGGKISATGEKSYGVYASVNSNVTISDGTITGTKYGVYVNSSTVKISGGKISATGQYSCGVYAYNSTVEISGGEISATGGNSYGVEAYNSTVEISGGKISATGKSSYGVYASVNSNVTISDGTITGTNYGVQAYSNSTVTISGGKVSATDTYSDGVYADNSTVTITGGAITGSDYGVYADSNSTVTITGGEISGETNDLKVNNNGSITLGLGEDKTGATFPGDLKVSGTTLDAILDKDKDAAYWKDTRMIIPSDGETNITGGDVTVKAECEHTTVTYSIGGVTDATKHKVVCPCGYEATENHTFDDNDGKCSKCKTDLAEASVKIGKTTTYYETLDAAITDAESCVEADNAVVTLLKNINLGTSYQQIESGMFTLDLNGCTLAGIGECVLHISGGKVTITDGRNTGAITNTGTSTAFNCNGVRAIFGGIVTITGGTISASDNGVCASSGTVTITGGTISGTGEDSYGVEAYNSTVKISGGAIISTNYGVYADWDSTVTINGGTITGGNSDLRVQNNGSITLGLDEDGTGATFPDGLNVEGAKLKAILGEDAAYWQEGKMLTNIADNATEITGGTVTVEAVCEHEVTTYPDNRITATQHTLVCSKCGYEVTGDHTFDGKTRECSVCKKDLAVASVTIGGNTSYYRTLGDAVSKVIGSTAEKKAVVTLLQDINLGNNYPTISSGVMTLNLNGCKLEGSGDYVLKISGDETSKPDVTITDSGKGGTISGAEYGVYAKYSTVEISGGTISNTENGVYAFSSIVTITGGTITSAEIGVCTDESSVEISSGIVSGTTGVGVSGGKANISGGTISGTEYGVYAINESNVTFTSGEISCNEGHSYGMYANYSTVEISGGTISGMESGVYAFSSTVTITGGTITGTGEFSFGVSAVESAEIIITGGTITGGLYDLHVYNDGSITLDLGENDIGATFTGGLKVSGTTLVDILDEGAAYWQGSKMLTNIANDATVITGGTVTVKAVCEHKNATYPADDINDTQHTLDCSKCGYEVTENHTLTYTASGNVITESCSKCKEPLGTATISAEDKTYDGVPVNFDVKKTGTLEERDIGITYSQNGQALESAINAGNYTASITIGGKTASADFTIKKATPTYTVPTGLTATYGDTLADVTLSTGWTWKDAETTSVGDAGTRTFKALYNPDSNNYNTAEADITVEVAKAQIDSGKLKAPVFAENLVYTGKAQALVSTPGSAEGGTMVYSTQQNGTYGNIPKVSEAGTYTVWYMVKGDSNHEDITSESKTVTIAPRTVTAPLFDGLKATYLYQDGAEIKPAFTLKDDLGNEIPATEYTVVYSNNTAEGTATITVTDQTGGNYIVSGSATFRIVTHVHEWSFTAEGDTITATCSGTIGECPIKTATIQIAAEGKTYDGTAFTATLTGNIDGVDDPAIRYFQNGTELNESVINAGTYTASIKLGDAEATVEFTITPATLPDAVLSETGYTYNGQQQKPAVIVTDLTENTDYTVTYPQDITNAGEKTVTITGKGNYAGTVTKTFSIAKANSTVTKNPQAVANLVYNGKNQNLVIAGEANGGTMQYSLDGETWTAAIPVGKAAKTYNVSYKVAGDANHEDSAVQTLAVTIAKGAAPAVDTLVQTHFFAYATENTMDLTKYLPVDRGTTVCTLESVSGDIFSKAPMVTEAGVLSYTTRKLTAAPASDTQIRIKAVMENYADTELKVTVKLLAVTAQTQQKIVKTELTEVPDGLADTRFNSVDAIKNEQKRVLNLLLGHDPQGNIAHYDVKLQFSPDGGKTWVDATEENFPQNGLTVTLPYPSGTGKNSHNFFVSHMFTTGTKAGTTENPAVTKTAEGIRFNVTGLSPVSVAWSAIPFDVKVADVNNGTVNVSPDRTTAGAQVTITVTPKTGYQMSTLTVKDAAGNSCPVSTDNNGRYYFTMPAANVTVTATFREIYTDNHRHHPYWDHNRDSHKDKVYVEDHTNPKTGDDFQILFWSGMAMTSLLSLAVLMLDRKKFYRK